MLYETIVLFLLVQYVLPLNPTEECLLVGTVNGDVLCLDSDSGIVKWTFNTGSVLIDYNFKKLESEDVLFLPSVGFPHFQRKF
jgi:hypothetical protein